MSDRLAAEIFIGGDVPASVVPELSRVIMCEQVSLEWGGGKCDPETAADLMEVRQEASGVFLLRLCDAEARWGEFDELEAVLQKHEIPYTRRTEGSGEYTAERVEFRPGMDSPVHLMTDGTGDPIVSASDLVAVETALAEAIERMDAGDVAGGRDLAGQALHRLQEQLPPALPPLTEFRITP